MTIVAHTIANLRQEIAQWRKAGEPIGLVPTMGALHDGHLSLMQAIRKQTERVVVTIFVNPTQFAPHEDFDRYPRNLESDLAKLGEVGVVDAVFAPSVNEMYPQGFATALSVGGPSVGLETDFRPHFFGGVATVVSKLLIAALPDVAIFGEKDYQQLMVIRRMTIDLGLPIEIMGGAIMRESDGLAMSSRNAYLSEPERAVAGRFNIILSDIGARARKGEPVGALEVDGARALKDAGFDSVDYVAIRDAVTLEKVDTLDRPVRILGAGRIGKTRLIDNMAV